MLFLARCQWPMCAKIQPGRHIYGPEAFLRNIRYQVFLFRGRAPLELRFRVPLRSQILHKGLQSRPSPEPRKAGGQLNLWISRREEAAWTPISTPKGGWDELVCLKILVCLGAQIVFKNRTGRSPIFVWGFFGPFYFKMHLSGCKLD